MKKRFSLLTLALVLTLSIFGFLGFNTNNVKTASAMSGNSPPYYEGLTSYSVSCKDFFKDTCSSYSTDSGLPSIQHTSLAINYLPDAFNNVFNSHISHNGLFGLELFGENEYLVSINNKTIHEWKNISSNGKPAVARMFLYGNYIGFHLDNPDLLRMPGVNGNGEIVKTISIDYCFSVPNLKSGYWGSTEWLSNLNNVCDDFYWLYGKANFVLQDGYWNCVDNLETFTLSRDNEDSNIIRYQPTDGNNNVIKNFDENFEFDTNVILQERYKGYSVDYSQNLDSLNYKLRLKNLDFFDFFEEFIDHRIYVFTLNRVDEDGKSKSVAQICCYGYKDSFAYGYSTTFFYDGFGSTPAPISYHPVLSDSSVYMTKENTKSLFQYFHNAFNYNNCNLTSYNYCSRYDDYFIDLSWKVANNEYYLDLSFPIYDAYADYYVSFNYLFLDSYDGIGIDGDRITSNTKALYRGKIATPVTSIYKEYSLNLDSGKYVYQNGYFAGDNSVITSTQDILYIYQLTSNIEYHTVSVTYFEEIDGTPFANKVTKENIEIICNPDYVTYDYLAQLCGVPNFRVFNNDVVDIQYLPANREYVLDYGTYIWCSYATADGNTSSCFYDLKSYKDSFYPLLLENIITQEMYEYCFTNILAKYPNCSGYSYDTLYGYFGFLTLPETHTLNTLVKDIFDIDTKSRGTFEMLTYTENLSSSAYQTLLNDFGYNRFEKLWEKFAGWVSGERLCHKYLVYCDGTQSEFYINHNGQDGVSDGDGVIIEGVENIVDNVVDVSKTAIKAPSSIMKTLANTFSGTKGFIKLIVLFTVVLVVIFVISKIVIILKPLFVGKNKRR